MILTKGAMCEPGIAEKVALLSKPEIYPIPTRRVEAKETHMSWVFLTDTHAYKLKKPVRYSYLDFSTIAARHHNCKEEVRLNRRLAPNVYEAVIPLTISQQGELQLSDEGKVVDWLVRMRRLPADRMLDYAIAEHTVSDRDAGKVGSLLADFYNRALPARITASEYREQLAKDIQANRLELCSPDYELNRELLDSITTEQLKFLVQKATLLRARVSAGKILEGHGDLRPEHICLEYEPVIIDCLEFNRNFRILDAASELSFLALECERLGAPRIGRLIFETYSEKTGDQPPGDLLLFYKSFHACLRAKIAVWHLKDHDALDWAKWTGKAKRYLELAACIMNQGAALSNHPNGCS